MGFELDTLNALVAKHGRVARVVIAEVKGSSPREVGAAMLVWEGGQSGTIGGGALVDVAAETGRGDVVPAVAAAAAARQDVIDREPLAAAAAVLAALAVAVEDVPAGQGQGPEGDAHELPQADHRRQPQPRPELTPR